MTTDNSMQLGMVGLGRMGSNIVRRLMADGHRCVGYDVSADAVSALEADGAGGATTIEEFVAKLEQPRAVWVMVPAGDITDQHDHGAGREARPGRRHHRRRKHPLPRRHPARERAAGEGHPPRRLRYQRWGLGPANAATA